MTPKCDVFKAEDFCENPMLIWTHVAAEKANAILAERATVVYGYEDPSLHDHTDWSTAAESDEHTHTALLVSVQPIERPDTAEGLLREMLDLEQSVTWRMPADVLERAKRLLEGK